MNKLEIRELRKAFTGLLINFGLGALLEVARLYSRPKSDFTQRHINALLTDTIRVNHVNEYDADTVIFAKRLELMLLSKHGAKPDGNKQKELLSFLIGNSHFDMHGLEDILDSTDKDIAPDDLVSFCLLYLDIADALRMDTIECINNISYKGDSYLIIDFEIAGEVQFELIPTVA